MSYYSHILGTTNHNSTVGNLSQYAKAIEPKTRKVDNNLFAGSIKIDCRFLESIKISLNQFAYASLIYVYVITLYVYQVIVD